MALRLGSTVINCSNFELMTAFWSRALGLRPGPLTDGGELRVLGGDPVNISLQVPRTPVTTRSDTCISTSYTADKPQEVERLIALSATSVRTSGNPDDDYDVLRDPEGNEFCVCLVPERSVEQRAIPSTPRLPKGSAGNHNNHRTPCSKSSDSVAARSGQR